MDTHVATHELLLTRLLPAAPEAVFAAWTDPARVTAWWGPRGMTTPECRVELRPGGRHETLMRDAEGREYRNTMLIEAVEPARRLALRIAEGGDCPFAGATASIAFAPDPVGTRLDIAWRHPTAEMRARHEEMGFHMGWGETLDKLSAHVAPAADCPVGTQRAAAEHGWLHRLLGDWRYEITCQAPDGTEFRATGTERVRPLGGFWVVGEGEGEMPGGTPGRFVMSLGYETGPGRFRGSWIGTMMEAMFVYDGALSEDGRSLVLDSEGPAMSGAGRASYRDTVTLTDAGERLVVSAVRLPDGGWQELMRMRCWRR